MKRTSPKSQLAGFHVFQAHPLPVEQIAQALRSVTLVDPLASALLGKVKHEVGQLVDRVVDSLGAPIHNVDTIVGRVLDQLFHVATETGQVGGDTRNTHHRALGRCISPWLIVGREHSQMGSTDKVIVIQGQHGVGGVEELGMKDNLHPIRRMVEEFHTAELVQDRILVVVDHIVGDDRGETEPFHAEQAATEEHPVLTGDEVLLVGHVVSLLPLETTLVHAFADALFDVFDGVTEGLDHRLALERLDREGRGLSRHNDKGNDGHG